MAHIDVAGLADGDGVHVIAPRRIVLEPPGEREFVRDELNEETLEEMGVDDTADGWSRTRLLDAVGKLKRGEGEG